MKKIYLFLILVFGCFLFTGCSNIKEINLKHLQEKLNNKDTFILEVMRTNCSHCKTFGPKFNKVLKQNKLKAYKIDIEKMSEKEKSTFDGIIYVAGTPNVVFIKNGKEMERYTRIDGDVSKSKIEEKLKDAGFIK